MDPASALVKLGTAALNKASEFKKEKIQSKTDLPIDQKQHVSFIKKNLCFLCKTDICII